MSNQIDEWEKLTNLLLESFPEYTKEIHAKKNEIQNKLNEIRHNYSEQRANTIDPKPELKPQGAPTFVDREGLNLDKELKKTVHQGSKDIRDFIKAEQEKDDSYIANKEANQKALDELDAEIARQHNDIHDIDPNMPLDEKAEENTKDITGQKEVGHSEDQQDPDPEESDLEQNKNDITSNQTTSKADEEKPENIAERRRAEFRASLEKIKEQSKDRDKDDGR